MRARRIIFTDQFDLDLKKNGPETLVVSLDPHVAEELSSRGFNVRYILEYADQIFQALIAFYLTVFFGKLGLRPIGILIRNTYITLLAERRSEQRKCFAKLQIGNRL